MSDQINLKVKDQASEERGSGGRLRCAADAAAGPSAAAAAAAAAPSRARRAARACRPAPTRLVLAAGRDARPAPLPLPPARITPRCTLKCAPPPSSTRRAPARGWLPPRLAPVPSLLPNSELSPRPLRAQIFDAYVAKKSIARNQVRFLFDGQRINPTQTPAEARRSRPSPPLPAFRLHVCR